jgi:hypothetical protein
MPAENDAFETDDPASEWQFGEWSSGAAAPGGGGLLQTILNEVTAIREGAAADRVALAKAISASFSKVDAELADVRGQLTSVRTDLDDLRSAVAASGSVDVRPQLQEALAGQREVLAADVVGAIEKQLDALRDALPSDDLARVAMEVQQLRTLLVGGA